MEATRPSRPALLVALLAASLILYWGQSRLPELAYDDAFITYRYAANMRDGAGLVFNRGETVLGTTTPLFAFLLGGLGRLAPDIAAWGHWIGVLAWAATAAGSALWLVERRRPTAALLAPWLIALQPPLLLSLGMETALLVALMFGAAWAWWHDRKRLLVALGALLILTRPDTVLWLLVLGLAAWHRERRLPWREAVGVTTLLLPWLVWATWRYGAPWPNSAAAKIGQNALMPIDAAPPFALAWLEIAVAGWPVWLSVLFGAALVTAVWPESKRRFADRPAPWLLLWTFLYLVVYSGLGVVAFPWYFVPPLVVTLFVSAIGAGRWLRKAPWGAAPALLMIAGYLWVQLPLMPAALPLRGHRADYRAAAEWLRANTPPDATVATIEIGVLGYYSERPLLDTMGLVSRSMTDHQLGWRETLVYALNSQQPDYAIALPGTAWDWVTSQSWFRREYSVATTAGEVTIYRRDGEREITTQPVEIAYEGGLTLTGLGVDKLNAAPGEEVTAVARLQVTEHPGRELLPTLVVIPAGDVEPVAVARTTPFDGGYSARLWQPGDELTIPVTLKLPDTLPSGAYRIDFLLYDPAIDRFIARLDAPGATFPVVVAEWLRVGRVTTDQQPEPAALLAVWEDGIGLAGRRLAVGEQSLIVDITWTATAVPAGDWTVFAHLVDASGTIVAQQDRQPLDGRLPTPAWRPGEAISDQLRLPLPNNMASGSYGLRLGFYAGVERLSLAGGSGDALFWPDVVQVNSAGEVSIESADIGGE